MLLATRDIGTDGAETPPGTSVNPAASLNTHQEGYEDLQSAVIRVTV